MKFPLILRRKHAKRMARAEGEIRQLTAEVNSLRGERDSLRSQLTAVENFLPPGADPYDVGDHFCPVCGTAEVAFRDMDREMVAVLYDTECVQPVFSAENPNLLNYTCSNCGASDRERLIAEYLHVTWAGRESSPPLSLLDIAPAPLLAGVLKSFPFVDYRSGDLLREDVDDRVDVTDMGLYDDDRFDCVLCSHVLEHVPEDRKALSELHRVTKPGGTCILLVPILLALEKDYENEAIQSPSDRWKHFLQGDHCRVYSKEGFSSKIREAGFNLTEFGVEQIGADRMKAIGVHPRTVLYLGAS